MPDFRARSLPLMLSGFNLYSFLGNGRINGSDRSDKRTWPKMYNTCGLAGEIDKKPGRYARERNSFAAFRVDSGKYGIL